MNTQNMTVDARDENYPIRHPDYNKELIEIVRSNISPIAMKERLADYHDNDIADALEDMSPADRSKIYRLLDANDLADIFEYLEESESYLHELSLRKRIDVLARMESTATADYLKDLPKNERAMLLELLPEDVMQDVVLLLSFDEDEIGSVMTTNFIEVEYRLTIKDAMKALVEQAAENDNIATIYVVDENHTFYGALDLKDLIIAREDTKLIDLVTTSYPYLYAHEQIEDCVERIKKYSEDSIPVLDEQNKMLGVITAEDFIQVVDDEMGEDYAMLAGLSAEEDVNEPVLQSVRKRLPWLIILLFLGMIVSSVVGIFESVVSQLTLIVCFQSLILDMAGNVGTQSLGVTIRVLVDEQISGKDKFMLVLKEARIGLVNGLLLGTGAFAVIGCYIHWVKAYAWASAFSISACIGAALLGAMFLSSIVGTVVPLFFKRIKVDPAVASGPLITTMNDLVAVITYYGLTWIFLINVLHLGA